MELDLQNKVIHSEIFQSTKEFWQDSYRLDNLAELKEFLKSPNQGLWVEKKAQSN